jgi:hypothetical protein
LKVGWQPANSLSPEETFGIDIPEAANHNGIVTPCVTICKAGVGSVFDCAAGTRAERRRWVAPRRSPRMGSCGTGFRGGIPG